MTPKKRVTIKQVAKAAGVSTQTVSRVVNERPDVASDTRQRVLDVIQHLGYQPNVLARSLIQRRSYTLGVVTAGLKFIGPSRTLNGMSDRAESLGYTLLLKELSSFNHREVQPIIDSLLARQVDGIIWAVPEVGDNREPLQERLPVLTVPIVFITMERREGWHIVAVDNYRGGLLATRHLLETGRRRIGHIAGPQDWWEARQRKLGWEHALAGAGQPVSDHTWATGGWSSASGEPAFLRLLGEFPDMDAVFVANDQMALSVLHVAHRQGIAVPDDLAVVGFDGIQESAHFWPSLTTIDQNQHELGCTAVQQLVHVIETNWQGQEPVPPAAVYLQPELVVRQSSLKTGNA